MASISPTYLDCKYSPHVSGKTDNRCRLTITKITQTDGGTNQTTVDWKITVEGTPYSYLYALYVSLGGKVLYDHHTGGAIKTSWNAGDVIASGTTTFNNNSDGSLTLNAYIKQMFYYGNGDTTRWTNPKYYQENSTNMVCSTIARASSISSSASYTKGDAVTVSISRASSNFTHKVQFLIGSDVVKEISGVGTSVTWTPTKAEVESMLSKGTGSTIKVLTYNGTTHVGTASKTGTASNPVASTVSNDFSFTVGNKTSFTISRNKTYYTHSLEISVAGKLIKTISNVGTSAEWTPNSSELTAIYNAMSATPEATISVKCITYSRSANIGNKTKTGTITISSSGNQPTFTAWTYQNNNSISNNVLGTNQVMLQNYNSISIVCSAATAKNQASISKYQAIVNGSVYETTDTTNRKITIPNLNLSGDILFQVRAIDSRGFMTTVEKVISFIAYSIPALPTINLKRKNNYEEETSMALSGSISLIKYNNVNKNKVKVFKYRYKNSETSEYSDWVDILTSTMPETAQRYDFDSSNGKITLNEVIIGNFETGITYQFEFIIQDEVKIQSFNAPLINGIPLMALRKRKLGINCVPDKSGKDGLYLNGNYTPYESIVYDNSTGTEVSMDLDVSIKNCEYVIIEFKANNILSSVRIDDPINKTVSLVVFDAATGTVYMKNIVIKEKAITVSSYCKVVLNSSKTTSNDIKIIKIIQGN